MKHKTHTSVELQDWLTGIINGPLMNRRPIDSVHCWILRNYLVFIHYTYKL